MMPAHNNEDGMMRKLISGAALALATLTIAAAAPMKWNVDVPHTGIEFKVNHFFTPVSGKFDTYEIDLMFDRENPAASSVEDDEDEIVLDDEPEDTALAAAAPMPAAMSAPAPSVVTTVASRSRTCTHGKVRGRAAFNWYTRTTSVPSSSVAR